MDSVNILSLRSSNNEDEEDIFLKATISRKPDHQSSSIFPLILKATNGAEIRSSIPLSYLDIVKSKTSSNKLPDDEWAFLVYQVLFHDFPNSDIEKYELLANETSETGEVWEIKLVIRSHKLKNSLGVFFLSIPTNGNPEDYDPFQWSILLQKSRDEALKRKNILESKVLELEQKIGQMINEQTCFYEDLEKKQIHQLKVFSKILNDQQKRYRDLVIKCGIKDPSEDFININYIKSVDHLLREEENKPKKQKQSNIKESSQSIPIQPALIRKTPLSSPKKKINPPDNPEINVSIIRGINHIKSFTEEEIVPPNCDKEEVTLEDIQCEMEGEEINEIANSTDVDEMEISTEEEEETSDKDICLVPTTNSSSINTTQFLNQKEVDSLIMNPKSINISNNFKEIETDTDDD